MLDFLQKKKFMITKFITKNKNEYDDDKELDQTLDYAFTRVDSTQNFATQMGIDAPGTSVFVDSSGYEMHRQIGTFGEYNDQETLDLIESYWNSALDGHLE